MNINEEYMFDIRKINKTIKGNQQNSLELQIAKRYKDNLIADYSRKISEYCFHQACIDDGYYKIKGKEVWLTDREDADFRVIVCQTCGKEIYLIKNDDEMWDSKIGNAVIEVKGRQHCKRV